MNEPRWGRLGRRPAAAGCRRPAAGAAAAEHSPVLPPLPRYPPSPTHFSRYFFNGTSDPCNQNPGQCTKNLQAWIEEMSGFLKGAGGAPPGCRLLHCAPAAAAAAVSPCCCACARALLRACWPATS